MCAATPFTKPVAELERLTAGLVAMAHAGNVPMCTDRPEWTSELEADRIAAAEVCGWCPMAGPCLAAGVASGSTAGVWGGVDLADRRARRAAMQAREAVR